MEERFSLIAESGYELLHSHNNVSNLTSRKLLCSLVLFESFNRGGSSLTLSQNILYEKEIEQHKRWVTNQVMMWVFFSIHLSALALIFITLHIATRFLSISTILYYTTSFIYERETTGTMERANIKVSWVVTLLSMHMFTRVWFLPLCYYGQTNITWTIKTFQTKQQYTTTTTQFNII